MINLMNQNFVLSPGYIVGLTQSDGSFSCSTRYYPTKVGISFAFQLVFEISTDLDSKHVLEAILLYFNCGKISIDIKDHTAKYTVTSKDDLRNTIIPFFINNPLFCAKLHAFNLFKQILEALDLNLHRSIEGRKEIVQMALSMNTKSFRTEERKQEIFTALGLPEGETLPVIANNNDILKTPLTDDNIAGVIDGDGSFWVSFSQDLKIKTGFSITTDTASIPLLKKVQERFKGIGSIQKKTETYSVYYVHGINQIVNILIPFMEANHLYSERSNHYEIFRKVSIILYEKKGKLDNETIKKIVEMAYDSNKSGKRRRLTKEEYLNLLT